MYEHARLAFSIVWLFATGCLLASALAVIFTWGDFLNYFLISLGIWCASTIGAIVTSL